MKFDVDVDFNNKAPKFTSDAININRCYNRRLQDIKKRLKKNNSKLKVFVKS